MISDQWWCGFASMHSNHGDSNNSDVGGSTQTHPAEPQPTQPSPVLAVHRLFRRGRSGDETSLLGFGLPGGGGSQEAGACCVRLPADVEEAKMGETGRDVFSPRRTWRPENDRHGHQDLSAGPKDFRDTARVGLMMMHQCRGFVWGVDIRETNMPDCPLTEVGS